MWITIQNKWCTPETNKICQLYVKTQTKKNLKQKPRKKNNPKTNEQLSLLVIQNYKVLNYRNREKWTKAQWNDGI